MDAVEVDAEGGNFFREEYVGDLIEARLLSELLADFADDDSLNVNMTLDRIFVHEVSQDDDLAFALDRIHRGDAHMRTLGVLSTPFVGFRVGMDDVPAQVVHWNYLRRQVLFVVLRPHDLPVPVVADQSEISIFKQGADGSSPRQTGSHQGFIALMRDQPGVCVLQLRQRLQAAVATGDVALHGCEVHIARRCYQGVGPLVVAGSHAVVEGPDRAFRRCSLFFLSGGSHAGGDEHASDDGHEDGKNPTHYWASRRTTGSGAAEAGKSMVSATRRRSGNRIRSAKANTTVPMGRIPQSRLSNSVGTAPGGGVILCAGGTSSFAHKVTLPLS